MSNYARKVIYGRLTEPSKKQLTFNVKSNLIELMDRVSDEFSKINDVTYTRNALLEDAIMSYISEIGSVLLEDYGINIYDNGNENMFEPEPFNHTANEKFDTVIYPGYMDGFSQAFLGENRWYYVRIRKEKIDKIKYIAIYLGKPVSAITHYAKVTSYQESKKYPGKYIVYFNDIVELPKEIVLGNCSPVATRSPKYTTLDKLKKASTFSDL